MLGFPRMALNVGLNHGLNSGLELLRHYHDGHDVTVNLANMTVPFKTVIDITVRYIL